MDDALASWLRLREAADAASRSEALTRRIADTVSARDPVRVLDLATGTGSNVRYLMPHLPSRQEWLVVDRSERLLEHLVTRVGEWASARGLAAAASAHGVTIHGPSLHVRIDTKPQNLGTLEDRTLFEGRHLVTASALLDLVSEAWLRTLAERCREAGAAALFTITYDGRSTCEPAEPEDDLVRNLFNAHQHTDKGLGGPAAGPGAVRAAEASFRDAGFTVEVAPSDWAIGPGERDFQRELIDGWAHAAAEMAPDRAGLIADWRGRRLAHVAAGRSRLTVGHHDLAAWRP